METTLPNLATSQVHEESSNDNCVTANSAGFSAPSPADSSEMLSFLKTMHQSIQLSNQLLIGLVSENKTQNARKRKASFEDDEPDTSLPRGKVAREVSTAFATAEVSGRQKTPSVASKSFSVLPNAQSSLCDLEFHTEPQAALAANESDNEFCDSAAADDDVVSLFAEPEKDPIDHGDNREQHDQPDPKNDQDRAANTTDSFLEGIESTTSLSTPTGPPISDHLARLLNSRFSAELSTAQRKKLKEKYSVPANCSEIFWPPVNEHIWNNLRPEAKGTDRAFVALQDSLVFSAGAIAISINEMLTSRTEGSTLDYQAIVTRLVDVTSLLGSASREISHRRKEALRPFINYEFKSACNRSTKPGKFLFGDDISKTMTDIKTVGRIVQKPQSKGRGASDKSRFYEQNFAKKPQKQPFLSQRGRMAYPPRKTQFQPKKTISKNWQQ